MHLRNHTTSYKIYETQDLLQKVGFVSISEKDLKYCSYYKSIL